MPFDVLEHVAVLPGLVGVGGKVTRRKGKAERRQWFWSVPHARAELSRPLLADGPSGACVCCVLTVTCLPKVASRPCRASRMQNRRTANCSTWDFRAAPLCETPRHQTAWMKRPRCRSYESATLWYRMPTIVADSGAVQALTCLTMAPKQRQVFPPSSRKSPCLTE